MAAKGTAKMGHLWVCIPRRIETFYETDSGLVLCPSLSLHPTPHQGLHKSRDNLSKGESD